jgi:hypothetical protein
MNGLIMASTNEFERERFLQNLNIIQSKLKEYEGNTLPVFNKVDPGKREVQRIPFTEDELRSLEKAIDDFTQKAPDTLVVPPPARLAPMAETMAKYSKENIAFGAQELKSLLQLYHHQVDDYYLNQKVWKTTDPEYQSLIKFPTKYSKKKGGAKNTGKRTGVYTFKDSVRSETMLLKQGANVGETVAEYIGANLYRLTIPDYSARCILAKDESSPNPTIDDVYVGSIFQKAKKTQDTFAAAGYSQRGIFAGEKARIKSLIKSKDSLIRKVLDLNDDTGHTLEYSAANVLWHGDHDFHTGNTVFVENENDSKFIKIDHGFSFFNFNRKVVDIFNPLAGKILSISPKRFLKGDKMVEFYPTNHFWDYAIENKQFYFNANFVKACEEITNCKPEAIRENIEHSLKNVQNIYGPHANEALKQFALRMGMKSSDITPLANKKNSDFLRYKIEDHMVSRLIERQASMHKLAELCKKQTAKLDKSRNLFSKKLNKMVISGYDKISKIENKATKHKMDEVLAKNQQTVLLREIELLKLVQQANDLGILEISKTGEFTILDEFYFYNSGQRQKITPEEFIKDMGKIVSNKQSFDIEKHYPLSMDSLNILREIRLESKDKENTVRKNKSM